MFSYNQEGKEGKVNIEQIAAKGVVERILFLWYANVERAQRNNGKECPFRQNGNKYALSQLDEKGWKAPAPTMKQPLLEEQYEAQRIYRKEPAPEYSVPERGQRKPLCAAASVLDPQYQGNVSGNVLLGHLFCQHGIDAAGGFSAGKKQY